MKNTAIAAAPHSAYLISAGIILINHPSTITVIISIIINIRSFFSEVLVKFAIIILNKIEIGAPGGIRTHTLRILSPSPLPVGVQGH